MPQYKLTITSGNEQKTAADTYTYGYQGKDSIKVTPKPLATDSSDIAIATSEPPIKYKRTKDKGITVAVTEKNVQLAPGDYYLDTEAKTFSTTSPDAAPTAGAAESPSPEAGAQRTIDATQVQAGIDELLAELADLSKDVTDPVVKAQLDAGVAWYTDKSAFAANAVLVKSSDKDLPDTIRDPQAYSVLSSMEDDDPGIILIMKSIAESNQGFNDYLAAGKGGQLADIEPSLEASYQNLRLFLSTLLGQPSTTINAVIDEVALPPGERTSASSQSGSVPTLTPDEITSAKEQIVTILNTVKGYLDNPATIADANIPGAPSLDNSQKLALLGSFAQSDFGKSITGSPNRFNKEVAEVIDAISKDNTVSAAEPFKNRAGEKGSIVTVEANKAANDKISAFIRSIALPYVTDALSKSDSAAALKVLKMGADGRLTAGTPEIKLYDNVLTFAALFDFKSDLEQSLKGAKVKSDGKIELTPVSTSPAPATPGAATPAPATPGAAPPAGAPGDATARSAAPTGAVPTGAVATSGAAQPGAAAEVTDIAVAAVRILNARPAPVQVFMDFGPPKSADIEQPVPLQWTIDPAYFSGYQLQINDSQRAIIAQYKNQQVILRVSATPLTGGRPVEVKQPLSIRTYRLPDQAELIPIKTFTFGRLAGTQSVSPEPAAQGGARDFSKRVAEVPCFFYKADGGVGAPAGDAVGVTSAASGRTYRFDFPEGFLVPIRIKFDEAKNPKTADKLVKLRKEQGLLSESKGKLLKEAGVPHWIFLKRRGALDSGRDGAGGGADAGADADAAGGLRVNIAVKTIVISTTDKLRVVGNSGNPWDASSFKAAFYPGKGAQFDKGEFPNAGLILCDDDFGLFSGLDRGAVMTAMYRVLFTDRAPDSSAYKLVGLQKWADDIRVIGSNPEVSATARRKPDNLFASA